MSKNVYAAITVSDLRPGQLVYRERLGHDTHWSPHFIIGVERTDRFNFVRITCIRIECGTLCRTTRHSGEDYTTGSIQEAM